MKKICFTIRNIDCGGGTERVCICLANALVEKGYEVYIVDYDSKKHIPFFSCNPQIKLWTILSHGGFERKLRWQFWYSSWKFRRFLKKHCIDVVIDVDTFNALWTAPAVRGLNIKWISWDHFNLSYCKGGKRRRALELVGREADKLVLLTKADVNDYINNTSVPHCKIKQIYNPLSFEIDEEIDHSGQKRITSIGRISFQKGFDLLLKSWKIVEDSVNDWELEIVCGYGDWEALQAESIALGCKNVRCLPPSKNVVDKLKKTAVYALPSRFEGFGLVITEAMSCSVPVVSYNCPQGPKEIICDGEDGFLVEPENYKLFADKLIHLMKDDVMRQKMGKSAYMNSKRFYMKNILPQWIDLIEGC